MKRALMLAFAGLAAMVTTTGTSDAGDFRISFGSGGVYGGRTCGGYGYGVPSYGVSSYGVRSYGVRSYGVPSYGYGGIYNRPSVSFSYSSGRRLRGRDLGYYNGPVVRHRNHFHAVPGGLYRGW